MSLTYTDPSDNDPGNVPGPQAEQPGWLDATKKYVNSLFGPSADKRPAAPAVDMARWSPVLESAGLGPDSPEHKLLTAISGHVNSAPVPREDSGWSKAIGVLGNTAAAGFLRRAGASASETQAPMNSMISDWRGRRDAADSGRMKAWEAGGNLMIPAVSNAVQQSENKRILREQAAANRSRIFGEDTPPAPSPTGGAPAGQGRPPVGGAPSGATTPAGQTNNAQATAQALQDTVLKIAASDPKTAEKNYRALLSDPQHGAVISGALDQPGVRERIPPENWQAAAQTVVDAAKGGGAPAGQQPPTAPQPGARTAAPLSPDNMPMAEPDRPMYQLGKGPHYFYTEQWRNTADAILRGNIDNNALAGMGIKVDPAKSKEAQAEDALMQLKKADEASHYQSPGYKGHVKANETYAEKRVQGGMDMKAKLDTGAEAGRNANRTLDLMRGAFEETQKQGVLGPGFATSWLTNINNALDRVGLPHMETAPIQMINELSNRMGIESMMEEMSAGNGMKGGGQRMFMAFREAVANTGQNPAGFAAIMEAMQALNNTQVVGQDAANEWLTALEKRGQVPVLDHNAQSYINAKKQEAFQQALPAVNRVIQGGQAAKPGAAQGAAPLEAAQSSEIQKRWQSATPDKRAAIEESLKARGYDPQAILQGGGAAPQKTRPQTQPRPDQTEELNRLRQLGLGLP